jgi:hypothetical protein
MFVEKSAKGCRIYGKGQKIMPTSQRPRDVMGTGLVVEFGVCSAVTLDRADKRMLGLPDSEEEAFQQAGTAGHTQVFVPNHGDGMLAGVREFRVLVSAEY